MSREQMNVVIVGHVDHGKSTVIGRLLADTGSLPDGKLEFVKATCARNAKPFEYAFLLDALKDERSQGITIDTARCFFKTAKRDYIILDAPGHIEFLKNMVTGASHAEAALLVIDAKEGIQENTRRHGLVLSMIGVKQVVVLVNKMDLVDFSREVFDRLEADYRKFLSDLDVKPVRFIPISAFNGDNLICHSSRTVWYDGPTVLEQLDGFANKEIPDKQAFRFPVQDIYKFTEHGDDRRILAGTVETGTARVGDEIVLLPSAKKSRIQSVEEFNSSGRVSAMAGESVGFTLATELYIQPGEMMVKVSELAPKTSCRFKANIFWVGVSPLIKDKVYKLKLSAARVPVKLVEIIRVLDASDLSSVGNQQSVNRHDVATCVLETMKPIAYDLAQDIETLSRFVIVDHYEIAGGGIVLEELPVVETTLEKHVHERERAWVRGDVSPEQRAFVYSHRGKFVLLTGDAAGGRCELLGKLLEKRLFERGCKAYYFDLANLHYGLDADVRDDQTDREEEIRRLGELSRVLTDAGQIFITALPGMDDYDVEKLRALTRPYEAIVVSVSANGEDPTKVHLRLDPAAQPAEAVREVCRFLKEEQVLFEYYL